MYIDVDTVLDFPTFIEISSYLEKIYYCKPFKD